MRFQRLDLNLLVALDALLSERSVSLAAERIFLSQSATSSALGRLREYFNDELLVMKGRQMVLTIRGEELIEPVRAVLDQIRTTIAVAPEFDPATSDRTITIMASDYATEVLLSEALNQFAQTAPHMTFEIAPLNDQLIETLERSGTDLLVTIEYAISSDYPSELLFEDKYVVVGWDGNPHLSEGMNRDLYFQLGHVTTKFGKARIPAFEEWFMRSQSMPRRVEIAAPSFLSVPFLLVGTARIATMHERLALRMARHLPLKIMPVPFDIPPIWTAIQWHSSSDGDRALRWVVSEIKRIADAQADNLAAKSGPEEDPLFRANLAERFQASVGALTRH
jgi:LysR family nod box-dependent transcriptional activator